MDKKHLSIRLTDRRRKAVSRRQGVLILSHKPYLLTTMMRTCFCLALMPALVRSAAFISPARPFATTTKLAASEAEEKLDKMSEVWSDLQKKEKEVERTRDEAAAFKLAEEMLETAIEFAETKEVVEEEHANAAHEALKNAISQEEALEAMEKEVHHDADDADHVLENYDKGQFLEDKEKRREMAVADISHHVEDYVEERLHQAKEAEEHAREEEEEAKRSLEELHRKEDELKATLEELKTLKPKKNVQE